MPPGWMRQMAVMLHGFHAKTPPDLYFPGVFLRGGFGVFKTTCPPWRILFLHIPESRHIILQPDGQRLLQLDMAMEMSPANPVVG